MANTSAARVGDDIPCGGLKSPTAFRHMQLRLSPRVSTTRVPLHFCPDLPFVACVVRTNNVNNSQLLLSDGRYFMKYAIIGSGKIGTALARTFARKNIAVAIANTRGPETLSSLAEELGPSIHPQSIQDAYD